MHIKVMIGIIFIYFSNSFCFFSYHTDSWLFYLPSFPLLFVFPLLLSLFGLSFRVLNIPHGLSLPVCVCVCVCVDN